MWVLVAISLLPFNLIFAAPQRDFQERPNLKCIDYIGDGFYCVPYHQCSDNFTIITDAKGIFDPRFECEPGSDCCPPDLETVLESVCDKNLEVCCLHPNSVSRYSAELLPPTCQSVFSDIPFSPLPSQCDPIFGGDDCLPDPTISCDPILGGDGCLQDLTTSCDPVFDDDCLSPPSTSCDPVFDEDCPSLPSPLCDPLFGSEESSEESSKECVDFVTPPSTHIPPSNPIHRIPRGKTPKCGLRNPNGIRSVSVKPSAGEAEFGEWPHMCAILTVEVLKLKVYKCGASLIDDGVILTAAHCVHGLQAEDLIVRCGEWNTQNTDEEFPHEQRNIKSIKIHPEFDIGNYKNNFAILYLEKDFQRKEYIHPVCLPEPCAEYTNSNCVANGWGKDKFGSNGRYSTILKEIAYPIVNKTQCQDKLRKTRLGQFFELDDSFMCAGGVQGVDTCKGDGGSPLTCRIKNSDRWVQAGIVSWGIGCGEKGVPAVYADVSRASCWIDYEVSRTFGSYKSHFGFLSVDCEGPNSVKACDKERSPRAAKIVDLRET